MSGSDLASRIESREAEIGVVGLGYVGLAAAVVIANAGFRVNGVERRADRVAAVNSGRNPIEGEEPDLSELLADAVHRGRLHASHDAEVIRRCAAVLVCVDTPVAADHLPRYEALRSACSGIGPFLAPEALVIVESTLSPGTMERIVRPALEQAAGGLDGTRFLLGHCPERVMPGRLLANMRAMDRVLGASSQPAAEGMRSLYTTFVRGRLDDADLVTAELVKTAENAYRDVQIAFANQLALVCERAGADVWQVRRLVNRSPGRDVLLPGSGVGGHCIPKDPWLLASVLDEEAGDSLLAAARQLNDRMPAHCADLVIGLLREQGVDPAGASVLVLGGSYLEESDDTRNSPTLALLPLLRRAGCRVTVHDPFVPEFRGDVMEAGRGADCAVVMVAHRAYRDLDLCALARVMRRPLLVDTRAVFDPALLSDSPFSHRRLGAADRPRATQPAG